LYAFDFNAKIFGWIFSVFSIAMIQMAAIEHSPGIFSSRLLSVLRYFIGIQCILVLVLLLVPSVSSIRWVMFHTALGLLGFVLPTFGIGWRKHQDQGAKMVVYAVIVAVFPAIVNIGQISPHQWFNYHVLAHVFMSVFFVVLYKGVMTMKSVEKE